MTQWAEYKEKEEKEMVNHPSHYNQYPKETIDMMVDIFGRDAVRQWCVMTAFKYRMRLLQRNTWRAGREN